MPPLSTFLPSLQRLESAVRGAGCVSFQDRLVAVTMVPLCSQQEHAYDSHAAGSEIWAALKV